MQKRTAKGLPHGKDIVAVHISLPCALVVPLPCRLHCRAPCPRFAVRRYHCRVLSWLVTVRRFIAVRCPGAARQRCHCRARGSRQRKGARQRRRAAHGKVWWTAKPFFPVVLLFPRTGPHTRFALFDGYVVVLHAFHVMMRNSSLVV